MKQRVINGNSLEFYNSDNSKKGEIKISGSDVIINPIDSSGTVIFGEEGTINDIEVGASGTPVDFTFLGGGTITPNGGTLTLGENGDTIDLSNATIGTITASIFKGGQFIGDGSGLTGTPSTFTNITASGEISASSVVASDIYIDDNIYHNGNTGTRLNFEGDNLYRVIINGSEKILYSTSNTRFSNNDILLNSVNISSSGNSTGSFARMSIGTATPSTNILRVDNESDNTVAIFSARRSSTYEFRLKQYAQIESKVNGTLSHEIYNTSPSATNPLLKLGHNNAGKAHITTYYTDNSLNLDGSHGVHVLSNLTASGNISASGTDNNYLGGPLYLPSNINAIRLGGVGTLGVLNSSTRLSGTGGAGGIVFTPNNDNDVKVKIDADGNISASGNFVANQITASGDMQLGGVLRDITLPNSYYLDPSSTSRFNNLTLAGTLNNGFNSIMGQITASGNISASGMGTFAQVRIGESTTTNYGLIVDYPDTRLLQLKRGGSVKFKVIADNADGQVDIYDNSGNSDIRFLADGDSYITNNLGIGTTSPEQKLTVESGYISVTGSGASGYGYELARAGLDTYRIQHLDGGLTIFNQTDTRKEMTFYGNGNVGIGNNTPAEALTVEGNISASGNLSVNQLTASANLHLTTANIYTPASSVDFFAPGSSARATRAKSGQFSTAYSGTIPDNGILFSTDTSLRRSEALTLTSNGNISASNFIAQNHITASGNISASGVILAGNGSSGAPSFAFGSNTNTGMFRHSPSQLALVAGGVTNIQFGTNAVNIKYAGSTKLTTTSTGVDITGDITATGTITAQEFHTEFVSASILFESGSTKFGDTLDDTHQFTGSLITTGSILARSVGTKTTKIVGNNDSSLEVENGLSIFNGTSNQGWLINSNATNDFGIYNWNRNGFVFRIKDNAPSNAVYINSSGNVGIGAGTSPSQKLDVQGTILVNNEVQFVDSNMRIFRSSNDMRLRTGGSDRITISGSGNVGIGTTTPSEKLEVNGNILADSYKISNVTVLAGSTNVALGSSGATGTISLNTHGGTIFKIDGNDNILIRTGSASVVGGTARMTVDVGSGTSSPISIVNGTTDGMYIRRYDSSGKYQIQTTVGSGNSGVFSLQTYGGNVGIGTTTAAEKLTVEGNISASGGITAHSFTGSFSGAVAGDATGLTGTPTITVNNINVSGDIIHNGDTDTKISLTNDDINIKVGNVNMLDFTENAGSQDEITFNEEGVDLDIRMEGDTDQNLFFLDAGNNKIGIGTSTPGEKLEVVGNISASGTGSFNSIAIPGNSTDYYIGGSGGGASTSTLRIGSKTTANTIAMELFHATNPVSLGISYSGGDALAFIDSVHSSFDSVLQFKTGGSERFRIGALNADIFEIKPASSADDIQITDDSGAIILYSDTGERHIGIGAKPSAKLHVSGSDSTDSSIRQSRAGVRIWDQAIDSSGRLQWGYRSSEGGSRTVTFTLDDNNNVGIGTGAPGEKLTVEGNISASGEIMTDSYFVDRSSGALLRIEKPSWTTATNHDILYNGWQSSTDDYVYLKVGGNSTSNHGIIAVTDNAGFLVGNTNDETGAVLDNTAGTFGLDRLDFRVDTSGNITASGNISASGNLIGSQIQANNGIELVGNLNAPDNSRIRLGSGADLQIYHDGSTSYIDEVGTGDLVLNTNGASIKLLFNGTEFMGQFVANGAARLYYDNSKKLETTSNGIEVTGEISASGNIKGLGYFIEGNILADMAGSTIALGYQNNTPIQIGRSANPINLVGQVTASSISSSGKIETNTLFIADTSDGGATIGNDQILHAGNITTIETTAANLTVGQATVATNVTAVATTDNAEFFVGVLDGASGNQVVETNTRLKYNPSSGKLTVSGDISSSGTVTAGSLVGTLSTAAQTSITSLGTLTSLTVDDITINGSTISDGGDLTLDIGGDLNIDVDGTDIILKDGGTAFGRFKRDSSDFIIKSEANNEDIIFRGQDAGVTIDALTLDMSDAGSATFNNNITASGEISASGEVYSDNIETFWTSFNVDGDANFATSVYGPNTQGINYYFWNKNWTSTTADGGNPTGDHVHRTEINTGWYVPYKIRIVELAGGLHDGGASATSDCEVGLWNTAASFKSADLDSNVATTKEFIVSGSVTLNGNRWKHYSQTCDVVLEEGQYVLPRIRMGSNITNLRGQFTIKYKRVK